MSITRRFLLAPSLARLIEKERGGHHVSEGYFPEQSERSIYVRVEEGTGKLILVAHGSVDRRRTPENLPHAHAEALLGLAAGGVDYRRIDLRIGAHSAHVSRFTAPGALDLITVGFEQEEQAREFQPPPWFGPEVTADQPIRTAPWPWRVARQRLRWSSRMPRSTACSMFWKTDRRHPSCRSSVQLRGATAHHGR